MAEDGRAGEAVKTLLALLWVLAAAPGFGQQFPSRPVKIVVPTSPGGATDALSRQIGARLSGLWGQPVIVENKPGANQIIGAAYVAKAAPDGNTLLVAAASWFVIKPHRY